MHIVLYICGFMHFLVYIVVIIVWKIYGQFTKFMVMG